MSSLMKIYVDISFTGLLHLLYPTMAKIAEDSDFNNLKFLVDNHKGWSLELNKADTKVWTKSIEGCSFQMVKIYSVFPDIDNATLFDVLHDPDYRKVWDSHMIASIEIGMLSIMDDIGYYASKYN